MVTHEDVLGLSCRHAETLPPPASVPPPALPVRLVCVPALPSGHGSAEILWAPSGADFSSCGSRSQFLLFVTPFLGLGHYTWRSTGCMQILLGKWWVCLLWDQSYSLSLWFFPALTIFSCLSTKSINIVFIRGE